MLNVNHMYFYIQNEYWSILTIVMR